MRLSSRIAKLEQSRPQKDAHVVMVFISKPEDEAPAAQQIADAKFEADRMGKDLEVIRIGFVAPD